MAETKFIFLENLQVNGYIHRLGPHKIAVIYLRYPSKLDFLLLLLHWSLLNNWLV